MKPKINEIKVKFIECGECGYERSCAFPESLKHGNFSWYCPKCSRLWTGILEKDGSFVAHKSETSGDRQYVLVELGNDLVPLVLHALRNKNPEESQKSISSGEAFRPATETLQLVAAETDAARNPQGFPQYRASILERLDPDINYAPLSLI